jgi:hypothetical protein
MILIVVGYLLSAFDYILKLTLKCCSSLLFTPILWLLSMLPQTRQQRLPISARRRLRHYHLMRKVRRRTQMLPSRMRFAFCKWEGGWSPPCNNRAKEPHHTLHLPKATYGRWYKTLTSDPTFDPLKQFRCLRLLQGQSPFLKKVPDSFREPPVAATARLPLCLHPMLYSHAALATPTLHSFTFQYQSDSFDPAECHLFEAAHDDPAYYPIVIDSGASVSVSPNPNDFVGGIHPTQLLDLKGINGTTQVVGQGVVEWTVFDLEDTVRTIRTTAYYVPTASIRLFSPQSYFTEGRRGSYEMDATMTRLITHDGTTLFFPYNCGMNVPLMLPAVNKTLNSVNLTYKELALLGSGSSNGAFMSVAEESNQNLTRAQKELLLWHWRLGHCNFQWVQALAAKPRTCEQDPTGEKCSPILLTKQPGVSTAAKPLCAACQLAKQSRRGAGTEIEMKVDDRDMILKVDKLEPGDQVSIDQYVSTIRGRLLHTKGKEKADEKLNGGTMFVDHATGFVFLQNQVSLNSGETITAKQAFERFAAENGVHIKEYRADNQPFQSNEFQSSLDGTRQKISFSGVGAKHQNGIAERTIQTICNWARAQLLHQVLHWPDSANLELWPFAIEHAVYIWNHLPRKDTKMAPIEMFTRSKLSNATNLLGRLHVWGCPAYVLEPKLQDGKKIPKWDPRVRRGQFLGFSKQHSSTVGLILNSRTGAISPQFHCVYDDLFTTVPNAEAGGLFDVTTFDAESWNRLIESGLERTLDDDEALELPDLHPDWLSEQSIPPVPTDAIPRTNPPGVTEHLDHSEPDLVVFDDEEALKAPQQVPFGTPRTPNIELREVEVPEHEASPIRFRAPSNDNDEGALRNIMDELDAEIDEASNVPPPQQPMPSPRRSTRIRKPNQKFRSDEWANYQGSRVANQRIRASALNESYLQSLSWDRVVHECKSTDLKAMLSIINHNTDENGEVQWLHPFALAAAANAEDNPNWSQAMNGANREGYWEAMRTELETLTVQKDAWDVVTREPWMNVLPSTWAFRCKRYPDGLIKKLKARFCVRGDHQREGVDFFDTFAPVVSWTTVRLMLILSLILDLSTRQVDYTAAFLHADIDKDPNYEKLTKEEKRRSGVYVEMPRGFSEPGKVLKLKKSLYGLKQAPRNFFQHLKAKLEKIGFESSESDACLFISDKVICIVYVDDTLLFSPKSEYIDEVLEALKQEQMDLEVEDDVAGFLGVDVQRNADNTTVTMTQKGLIERIVKALGCESLPIKKTPAEHDALGTDKEGEPPQEAFNYASVIGMLQYLHAHTRPDLTFAVSQCARFIHNTKRSHEIALLRIGQYLRGTMNKGLVLRPNTELGIDCFVDADFAGTWGSEDVHEPISVKSRTGYVLCLSGCPIVWVSKLQSDIALSTMEAEYNALSMAMKDLLPLKRLVETVSKAVGLQQQDVINMRTTVWEDNSGALTLANLEPGRMTPRSKHYGVKYHWFRSHLKPNNIEVLKIKTTEQQADIFTKGLRTHKFEENRKQLLGWYVGVDPELLRSRGSVSMKGASTYYVSPGIAWSRTHACYPT